MIAYDLSLSYEPQFPLACVFIFSEKKVSDIIYENYVCIIIIVNLFSSIIHLMDMCDLKNWNGGFLTTISCLGHSKATLTDSRILATPGS